MSSSLEEGPLKEAAIFTRAVENVFRKLIRLLLGRMTLVKLQEMIRLIFVEEAELHLKRERPGKNVRLTNMALLTGLDTRTLNKIFIELHERTPVFQKSDFLKEITPESNVLDFWSSNKRYLDRHTHRPITLKLKGTYPSFESLVDESCSLRGITANSMLVKLANSNSVLVNEEKDSVCLLESRFIPVNEKSYSARLEIGFATVGYLLETLLANIQGGRLPEQKYFQRSNWTSRLSLKNRAQFRSELRQYLQFAEKGAVSILEKYEESASEPGQTVGGFSMFYFEEDVEEQQTA